MYSTKIHENPTPALVMLQVAFYLKAKAYMIYENYSLKLNRMKHSVSNMFGLLSRCKLCRSENVLSENLVLVCIFK